MNDSIYRQAAIDAINEIIRMEHSLRPKIYVAKDAIKKLPSAQPEIICCKDCKHYEYGVCKKAGLCVNKSPNGFCDWGER